MSKQWRKLSNKELAERRNLIILEIQKISKRLSKPMITVSDFMFNSELRIPEHSFIRVFGGFGKACEAAGLKKNKFSFYEKKEYFKRMFKQIARKNGNKLSYTILMKELGRSFKSIEGSSITPYFGGMYKLCKEINCGYATSNKATKSFFENTRHSLKDVNEKRDCFSKRMLDIAKNFGNTLSNDIIAKNSCWSKNTVQNLAYQWFGGLKNMCNELGITWVEGDHGIDIKELDILKDLRDVYIESGRKISRNLYSKKGKHSLEAIEDYFGSFGKACLEVNIKTEAMKQ